MPAVPRQGEQQPGRGPHDVLRDHDGNRAQAGQHGQDEEQETGESHRVSNSSARRAVLPSGKLEYRL